MSGPADLGPRRRRRWRRRLTETVITLLLAALLSVLLRTYAGEIFWIPSASMVPTLAEYDRIVVQKAFFTWHDIREGDIVVFTHPLLDQCGGVPAGDLVKRVIALPGQTINSAGNSIYINGHTLAEPYLPAADPLGPADRKSPASLPRPARRVLCPGRQPRGLVRQPLLGAYPGLQHHRQGDPGHLARQPSRLPRPLRVTGPARGSRSSLP